MKGKKLMCAAAVAVLSVGITCGAAACSGVSTAAKGIKSEEITAQQWDDVFAFADETIYSDCKLEFGVMYNTVYYDVGIKVEYTTYTNVTLTVAGDNAYCRITVSQKGKYGDISLDKDLPDEEIYLRSNTDGTNTVYEKNAAGEWMTSTSSGTGGMPDIGDLVGEFDVLFDFEDYVYSKDRKGYVVSSDIEGDGCVIKFKDGKLAGIWQEYDDVTSSIDGREKITMSLTIKYGGQKVKLPNV